MENKENNEEFIFCGTTNEKFKQSLAYEKNTKQWYFPILTNKEFMNLLLQGSEIRDIGNQAYSKMEAYMALLKGSNDPLDQKSLEMIPKIIEKFIKDINGK